MSEKLDVEEGHSTDTFEKPHYRGSGSHFDNEKLEEGASYMSHANEVASIQQGVKRGLSARHIQMISLGAAIG